MMKFKNQKINNLKKIYKKKFNKLFKKMSKYKQIINKIQNP